MNVTAENFEASFEAICEAIRNSHFIALDAEFTGLRLPGTRERMMDSIQTRYDLARGSCSQFMLTQYGICCFRYSGGSDDDGGSGQDELEARPFNFFIMPSVKFGSDRVFSCQASSLDFLSKHGFDFQAWAAHGVPFLSRAEEEAIKDKLRAQWERGLAAAAEKKAAAEAEAARAAAVGGGERAEPEVHTARDGTTIETLEEPEKGMVKDALGKVQALLAESVSEGTYVKKSVRLEPMNGRQRWLMHEFVGSSTSEVKLYTLPGPAYAKPMEIRTVSKDPEQQAKEEAELRAKDEKRQLDDVRAAVGFRRVVDEIFKAEKPVICHNGLLDLLHTYDKFVGPIPENVDAGTKAIHSLLPRLFDSKVVMSKAMTEGMRFPRTVLGEAHQWLRETFAAPPPPPPPPPSQKEEDVEAEPGTGGGAEVAPEHPAGAAAAENVCTGKAEANGDSATNGDASTVAEGAPQPSPAEAAEGLGGRGEGKGYEEAATAERIRKGWDAVFAPGFAEHYKGGGQEHEAGYDAYLTGCCFAAAATVGLGVGVDEIKAMASGGEVPASLRAVANVVPLHRTIGGQRICLPGPAPPVDFSRFVHVSGFPPAARTDAVMVPIKAIPGCEDGWFHWIDDTSGVAEFKSAEVAMALLDASAAADAAAAAAMAAAGGGASEPTSRVVDPTRLLLEDLKLAGMDHALLIGGGSAPKTTLEGGEKRGTKRLRHEEAAVERDTAGGFKAPDATVV